MVTEGDDFFVNPQEMEFFVIMTKYIFRSNCL